jgi:prenyltransferase beta subunit
LINLWASDLRSEVRLTYKGGFFLAALAPDHEEQSLLRKTARYLHSQPNADGGFGPWRGHPIGSDPWSTGVCLVGLSRFPELADLNVVKRAVQWLIDTQLESGYWPYHFIDEGTAYAYWGLSEAAKLLEA